MEIDVSLRVDKLESGQAEILNILQKIERRLIGNIEEDRRGLIGDVRVLRKTIESIDSRMINLEKSNVANRLETLENEYKTISQKVEDLSKYRFIIYGGILVVAFLFDKVWDYIKSVI